MSRKLALALAATLTPLLLLEAGLRVAAAIEWRLQSRAFATLETGSPPHPGQRVDLAHLLRSSDNPRLLYELRPGLSVVHKGRTVTTDARGFRVHDSEESLETSSIRILGLGDSVMFGWGVSDSEVLLARLTEQLERRLPGSSWRAFNAAVPGYNTVMEVEALFAKGLGLKPDLVILLWVGNDLDLPNFLRSPPPALALDRSFAREWIRLRLAGRASDPFEDPIVRAGRRRVARDSPEKSPEEARYLESLPAAHRALAGSDAFDLALARLAEAASTHRFEVVVATARGRMPGAVRARFREHGFALVPTAAAIQRWLEEAGFERLRRSPLVLSARDPHPSALGHELLATSLADHLVESGTARKLVERRARLD